MAPDSQRRLLEAAAAEFSRHGLAGARVNRIAANARANKQLIYAYFGDKDSLFDTVLKEQLKTLTDSVRMDPYDLPSWVVGQFDFILANPDVMRLAAWQALERPPEYPADIETEFDEYVNLVGKAQREGKVTAAFTALDLIVMLVGLAGSWYEAFAPRRSIDNHVAWRSGVLETHREALRRAAELLVQP